jgi:hypothetical protein
MNPGYNSGVELRLNRNRGLLGSAVKDLSIVRHRRPVSIAGKS